MLHNVEKQSTVTVYLLECANARYYDDITTELLLCTLHCVLAVYMYCVILEPRIEAFPYLGLLLIIHKVQIVQ